MATHSSCPDSPALWYSVPTSTDEERKIRRNPRPIYLFVEEVSGYQVDELSRLSGRSDHIVLLYQPLLSHESYVRAESRSFLARVFAGNPLSAVAHFVEDESLSEEQLARLRALVEDREEEQP